MPHPEDQHPNTPFGVILVLCSLSIQNVGAAIAKHLFATLGASGMASLRIAMAALILMALRRPWRRPIPKQAWPSLLLYGAALGLMNTLIYQSFARIPIGIAIGIEVAGPVLIGLLGCRSLKDIAWLATIILGLICLLPLHNENRLDPLGVLFACGGGICWALYVLAGKRVSASLGMDAPALGLTVSTALILPYGLISNGTALLTPSSLMLGLAIAILSSALPYSLEIKALSLLPSRLFGTLLSTAPAIGAIFGFLILGEHLTLLQTCSILFIIIAAIGSTLTRPARPVTES